MLMGFWSGFSRMLSSFFGADYFKAKNTVFFNIYIEREREYMWFIQRGGPLKLVNKSTYLWSSVSLNNTDINVLLAKTWTAIDRLSVIWKSDLNDMIKYSFFSSRVVSILLNGCTTWTQTKRMEKKLDGNYTIMLRAILNKPWRQHSIKQQLYDHPPPITKTIQVRPTRRVGHCWRSKEELVRDTLLWTPSHELAKSGRPARTYIHQLFVDTGNSLEDLPGVMNDGDMSRERVWEIRTGSVTKW